MDFDFDLDDDLPPRSAKRNRGGGGGGNVAAHPRAMDAERRADLRASLEHVQRQLEDIANAEQTASQRIEKLLGVNSTIILGLLKAALAEEPDLDRSTVLSRAMTAIKDTVAVLKSKHDMEGVDTFNPRSPKFGLVFGWFIELVHKVLAQHVNETVSTNFFNDLVAELSGWEDRIERQFKGVSGRALASLQSPFIENFREQLRDATAREALLLQLQGQLQQAERRLELLTIDHETTDTVKP
jgi:flagellar motility protein MotE (MotC chaperone)